jgi:hypothetical protein
VGNHAEIVHYNNELRLKTSVKNPEWISASKQNFTDRRLPVTKRQIADDEQRIVLKRAKNAIFFPLSYSSVYTTDAAYNEIANRRRRSSGNRDRRVCVDNKAKSRPSGNYLMTPQA